MKEQISYDQFDKIDLNYIDKDNKPNTINFYRDKKKYVLIKFKN